MKSLWPHISSDDDAELMMIAIANNRQGGVETQLGKGVTGTTKAHKPVMFPGEISMFEFACYLGNFEAVQLLYEPGFDLDWRGDTQMTPLMNACAAIDSSTSHDIFDEGPQDSTEVARAESLIRWLIAKGADVNAIREADTMTVLHFAAKGCSGPIVELLVEHGARVDWPEDDKQPAFILAARENNVGALRALVRHGADINRRSALPWAMGCTALEIVLAERERGFQKPEAEKYLHSIGTKCNPKNIRRITDEMARSAAEVYKFL